MRISLFLLIIISFNLHASGVYKWVDENGQTQFSQFPPESAPEAKQIEIDNPQSGNSAAAQERLKQTRQKLLESSVDRNTETAEKKEAKEEAERMAENCGKAKQRLRDIQNNGRIYKTLEDGERHWYSEKEREGMISKAKDQVKKYCQ